MEKDEIKDIADYIKDFEEGLGIWDYRGLTLHGHLNQLYQIIKRLMDLVSVDEIEQLTGLNFLTSLPNNIQNQIEGAAATSLW